MTEGSIRDKVARAGSEEELHAWGALCFSLVAEGKMTRGTLKKIQQTGRVRLEKLRLLVKPEADLIVPEGVQASPGEKVSAGGIILV